MKTLYSIALSVFILTGCTAARSMSAINAAATTVETAQEVQAQTHAVYQYTRATEHLRLARLESNIAEYAAADAHAKEAQTWAEKAISVAKKHATMASQQTLNEPIQ
jgi:hypothetical protein